MFWPVCFTFKRMHKTFVSKLTIPHGCTSGGELTNINIQLHMCVFPPYFMFVRVQLAALIPFRHNAYTVYSMVLVGGQSAGYAVIVQVLIPLQAGT